MAVPVAAVGKLISSISIKPSSCLVLMEYFKDSKQLQDAITCSKRCTEFSTELKKEHATRLNSESCPVHPRKQRDLFCQQCTEEVCKDCICTDHMNHQCTESSTVIYEEIRKVVNVEYDIAELLEEMKQEISRMKEVKQTMRSRKDKGITVAKEVFATLRKAIDEREEEIITDLRTEGNKREKVLEVG